MRALQKRSRFFVGVAVATAVAGSVATGQTANATSATLDQGSWDSVATWDAWCTAGNLSWSCTYNAKTSAFDSPVDSTCTEASVNSGSVDANLSCAAAFTVTVSAEWVFDAAGAKVGCTSVSGTSRGTADYQSGSDSAFSRSGMPVTADVRNGVVDINGQSESASLPAGYQTWVAHLHLPSATCNPGESVFGSGAAPGSVTVAYSDVSPQAGPRTPAA